MDCAGARVARAVKELLISINISPEEFVRYYKGRANAVMATALDGRRVQFPANILRQFLTADGVCGRFRLRYDDKNKFVSISRVDADIEYR